MEVCKICGGTVSRIGNVNVCDACGNRWTTENIGSSCTDENKRAWEVLRNEDFEKATELFNNLIFKDGVDYEAYWGKALAENGITYVIDLNENKKIPTFHALSENSFLENVDVKKAIAKAPADIANEYQKQAKLIEKLRIEWTTKASKEPPYDIFISFKDSDKANGIKRTQDSIDAQDLYNVLISEGYKVFFSRISLRDKVGEQYEPYIYNALNTSKIMIVFGEKPEYFVSPWIRNEWTRYIKKIERNEKRKDSLIVLYKNINPGDLPMALANRQSIDYSSFDASTRLLKHIEKVIEESKKEDSNLTLSPNKMQEFKKDFDYFENELGKITIERCKNSHERVFIPREIDGKIVSRIGKECFIGQSKIKQINLPDSITEIEDLAFSNCQSLEKIHIPNGLTEIGEEAFYNTGIVNLTLPKSVKVIGDSAFCHCRNLKIAELSSGLTSIRERAFQDCKELERVILPDTLVEIANHAFCNCHFLNHIALPDSLLRIGEHAFVGAAFEHITIPSKIKHIEWGTFDYCHLSSISLPDGLETIGNDAFRFSEIERVNIPSSVNLINHEAFYACKSLKEITIEGGKIAENAFSRCKNLKKVTIKDKVTEIDKYAFSECSNLTELTIPKTLNNIHKLAFFRCPTATKLKAKFKFLRK